MIIVDAALEKCEKEGRPIRIGLMGAGYMGRGIALQFLTPLVGMRLVAIFNRTLSEAGRAFQEGGVDAVQTVGSRVQLEEAIASGRPAITDDPSLLCQADGIDAIIEATGEIEFGAQVALEAIENSKH